MSGKVSFSIIYHLILLTLHSAIFLQFFPTPPPKKKNMADTPSLLTLPTEIRLQIYHHIIGPPRSLLLSQYTKTNTWTSPAISKTCRLLRNETLYLHYHTHAFTYDLRSPLDSGLLCLKKALRWLESQGLRLKTLRLKHVSRGVVSMDELTAWVLLFVAFRAVLPPFDGIAFCQGPLRYREFAAQAAVALRQLVRFAAGIDGVIVGSGEESAVGGWIAEALERTHEGRVVIGGLRVAEEFVRGFRAAAGGEVQGVAVLRWATMNGGSIEGMRAC